MPLMADTGSTVSYTHLELDWRLPWEHVSPGCSRGFLEREYRRSLEGVTTPDCTRTSCTGCGICPTLHAKNVLMGDRA